MRRKGMGMRFWWESQMEKYHQEDLDIWWKIILKLMLDKQDGVVLTELIWTRMGIRNGLLCKL
jgi:hypothetical protein